MKLLPLLFFPRSWRSIYIPGTGIKHYDGDHGDDNDIVNYDDDDDIGDSVDDTDDDDDGDDGG